MGMFDRTLVCPPFGRLTAQGQSSIWEGTIKLEHLGADFELRVHGQRAGPLPEQAVAFKHLLANVERLRSQAASALVSYLLRSGVVPRGVELSDTNLWRYLQPCWIEVHDGADARACTITFATPWDSVGVSIDVVDGELDDVHSEG